jgi:DNA polymerase-3 subunit gamma/tau
MAYQVTARKWRPRKFDEVVAQDHITTTLKNAILSERIAQCYLLCGPRGVGKTTTARILAKALNCSDRQGADPCDTCESCQSIVAGTSMNVLEVDGASNNSVEDIRELREVVRYAATEGTYKIYIIDEVHMLSTAAFNALLKTLEEPPAHVVFIFATTEVQAVPDTILSRCQRFNFRRVAAGQIAAHLRVIADGEGIVADERALFLLANRADGALRDAESLFDQVVSLNAEGISADVVEQVLGLVDRSIYFEIMEAVVEANPARVIDALDRAVEAGAEVEEFTHGLVELLRHVLLAKVQESAATLDVAEEDKVNYETLGAAFATEDVMRMLQVLMDLEGELKRSVSPRFRLELALVRFALMGRAVDVGELLTRIKALEEGAVTRPSVGAKPTASNLSRPAPTTARESRPSVRPEPPAPDREVDAPKPTEKAVLPASESSPSRPPVVSTPTAEETLQPPADDSSRGSLSFEQLSARWDELIDAVRGVQPALAIFLKGARLLALEGKSIKLGFVADDRFPMAQVVKNRESIEAICAERLGDVLRLNCVVAGGAEEDAGEKKKVEMPEDDSTVQSILDTFDGELV